MSAQTPGSGTWLLLRTLTLLGTVSIASTATPLLATPTIIEPAIAVDQFGYLETMRKVAIVADPQAGFNAHRSFSPGTGLNQYQVRRWTDDTPVFSGTLQPWRSGATHAQSGDRGWHFDFSQLVTPGTYYVWDTVNQVGSGRFEIGPSVYDAVLRHAVRTFFYQRLNFPKSQPYAAATWTDLAAYEGTHQDRYATSRWAKGDPSTQRDLHGGWMDAGDTNKYVTFARDAVIQLLDAYRMNPAVFGDDFGIPESGNGLSDLLDEIRWELGFLGRMQDATGTGGLLLKVGVDTYDNEVTPPSRDTRPRYYLPECTSSTIAGSAMFAAAGVVFRAAPGQAASGDALIARAEAAWTRAKATTSTFSRFETGCDDGHIKSGDADVDRDGQLQGALMAAVSLFEATGKAEYKDFVESRFASLPPYSIWWWGPYWNATQAALLRYASLPGVSVSVANAIRSQKALQNGVFSIDDYTAGTDLYRAHLADAQYHWGHNQVRANTGNLNLDFVTFQINPASAALYRAVAEQHLHWLHGANPLGLAMLSNMASAGAESSANEIYHTWFQDGSDWDDARTSRYGPAPGYLTGGPNTSYSGSVPGIANQPPQKAYKDWNSGWPQNSWEITEPAIYSQAAYVQLLARLMTAQSDPSDTQPPSAPTRLRVASISQASARLTWAPATDDVGVVAYDVYADASLLMGNVSGTSATLSGLACGTRYRLSVKARDAAGNSSAASAALTLDTMACPKANTVAYADALTTGWADWSWGATRNFANLNPKKVGMRSIRVAFDAWGGLSLRHEQGIAVSSTSKLAFWAFSPVPLTLAVSAQDQDTNQPPKTANVALPGNVWKSVVVKQPQLGGLTLVKRLNIQYLGTEPRTVYFDQIRILR